MAKEMQSDEFKKLISLGEEKGFLTYDTDGRLPKAAGTPTHSTSIL